MFEKNHFSVSFYKINIGFKKQTGRWVACQRGQMWAFWLTRPIINQGKSQLLGVVGTVLRLFSRNISFFLFSFFSFSYFLQKTWQGFVFCFPLIKTVYNLVFVFKIYFSTTAPECREKHKSAKKRSKLQLYHVSLRTHNLDVVFEVTTSPNFKSIYCRCAKLNKREKETQFLHG